MVPEIKGEVGEFGNKNTKLFHTQTVIKRRKNKITSLQIDDVWCSNEEVVQR